MHKLRGMVTCRQKVVTSGLAAILGSSENLEIIGYDGADVLEQASVLHPDLLVYELWADNEDYEVLEKIKKICGWTKVIIYSVCPLKNNIILKYLGVCDGYLQGPILPGFFLKAIELACYSGYYLFLGSSKDIFLGVKEKMNLKLLENQLNPN